MVSQSQPSRGAARRSGARTVRAVTTWLSRVAPIAIGVVGLIFFASGVFSLVSQGWTPVTGTVGACTPRVAHTGTSSRTTTYTCDVTWQAAGRTHTGLVDMGAVRAHAGQSVPLRVQGDAVALATAWWVGAGETTLGTLLVAVAVVLVIRRRRRTAGPQSSGGDHQRVGPGR